MSEQSRLKIETAYNSEAKIVLYPGYVEKFLQTIPDGSIDLIVTSPPYNMGKEYEDRTNINGYLDIDKFLRTQKETLSELCRVLSESGSICWQVGNYVKDGEVYPLDLFYYRIFKEMGLFLRNRIIWHFGHGLHASTRFTGRYETILWFTKSHHYEFNLDSVRVPAKYPGKRYSKGPKKGQLSGNPKGKNPSDVWEIVIQDWEGGFWDIPNVKANHAEKTAHPCQFPVELVERCVLALTDEGDAVLDPYAGVGSSLIAAIKHGRRAIGCEKEISYVDIARERINSLLDGTLRLRPLGKPVYEPKKTTGVAQVPEVWIKDQKSIYFEPNDE